MSVEQALSGDAGQQTPTQPETETQSLDDALDAVWSKHGGGEFDDSPVYEEQSEGPARGPDGKFVSQKEDDGQESAPDPKTKEQPQEGEESAETKPEGDEPQEGEQHAEEAAEGDEKPGNAAPVPSSWQHRKELWEQMPGEARDFISQREDELQRRQSDLGRQASEYKPVKEVLDHFKGLYDGQMSPGQAVGTLFAAQQGLNDPNTRLHTLMQIVESYGAADQLRSVLTGETEMPKQQQPRQPEMTPEQIRGMLQQELAADRANRETSDLVSRLSSDKPLYSEIPEIEMVYYIEKAWSRLGNTASQDAVFETAYDMAVNADPDLRAKAAAMTQVKAATPKPVSTEAAKRANSVNVTSTSSGKAQKPSLEKALDAVWEKHANGRT